MLSNSIIFRPSNYTLEQANFDRELESNIVPSYELSGSSKTMHMQFIKSKADIAYGINQAGILTTQLSVAVCEFDAKRIINKVTQFLSDPAYRRFGCVAFRIYNYKVECVTTDEEGSCDSSTDDYQEDVVDVITLCKEWKYNRSVVHASMQNNLMSVLISEPYPSGTINWLENDEGQHSLRKLIAVKWVQWSGACLPVWNNGYENGMFERFDIFFMSPCFASPFLRALVVGDISDSLAARRTAAKFREIMELFREQFSELSEFDLTNVYQEVPNSGGLNLHDILTQFAHTYHKELMCVKIE